jgi:hypothetical protein
MNRSEKALYHQIHPLKLTVDWGTGLIALYFFWQHALIGAPAIAVVPSLIASIVIIRFVKLERYAASRFGRYLRKYLTAAIVVLRFFGYAVMAFGAWYHLIWVVAFGLCIIVFAWLRGVILPIK